MKVKGLLKNIFTVGAFTALSRVFGLVREMLQSRFIGAGVEQSAFTLAFMVPNMFRKLFGEGALTAAFVPIFREEIEAVGLQRAAKLAQAVLTMLMLALGAVVALALAGICAAMPAAAGSSRWTLVLQLVAELLPYMLAICGAAFGMGVLNSLGRFKAAGFMPTLLNLFWIAGLALLAFFPNMDAAGRIRWVALAILLGGVAQMAYMFHRMAVAGVVPRFTLSGWNSPRVKSVWRQLGIGIVGAGATHINYLVDQALAQTAAPWAAGVLGYATRLMDLPLGVIGAAFGTVLLPTFAACFAKRDVDGARDALSSSVTHLMFAMVPASVGLLVLAPETVRVIYEGGRFDAVATVRVARALAVYASGLCCFGLYKSLAPWFQGQGDMKTPVRVSIVAIAANIALNCASVWLLPAEWRHVGMAAATVFASLASCVLLIWLGVRKNGSLGFAAELRPLARIGLSALTMGAVLYPSKALVAGIGPISALGILVTAGAAVYFAAYFAVFRILRRR